MAQAAPAPTSPEPLTVTVRGRVTAIRSYRTRDGSRAFSHIVKTPAPDPYTSPSTMELHAGQKLGDVGTDVDCICRLSGFGRSYSVTDPDTGDKRQVQTADLRLTVIG